MSCGVVDQVEIPNYDGKNILETTASHMACHIKTVTPEVSGKIPEHQLTPCRIGKSACWIVVRPERRPKLGVELYFHPQIIGHDLLLRNMG